MPDRRNKQPGLFSLAGLSRRLGSPIARWFEKKQADRVLKLGRKALVRLCTLILILWLGAWVWFSGVFHSGLDIAHDKMLRLTSSWGLQIENIYVSGRDHLERREVLAAIDTRKGAAILSVDPEKIQKRLESLSWVHKAQVQLRYPDTLYVTLKERQPLALWHSNETIALIDSYGKILTREDLASFSGLPVVTGKDAQKNAARLLSLLRAEPELAERVRAAAYIGERRWDLKLNNGLILHLPEKDVGLALSRLVRAHENAGIFDRDILAVDSRAEDRLIIKARPGAVHTTRSGSDM